MAVQCLLNEKRFVTHEELDKNLELCFQKYDQIKRFEKKKDEMKFLKIFSEQNDRIMIVDEKVCRTNLRLDTLEGTLQSLEEEIEKIDIDCKKLYEGMMSRKPSINVKQHFTLDKSGLVSLTEEKICTILAQSSSCVKFIGHLVIASFPRHYFADHVFGDVTNVQFIEIFQIVSKYFKTAILLSGEELKLACPCDRAAIKEVAVIMETQINIWREKNGYVSKKSIRSYTKQDRSESDDDEDVKLLPLSERQLDKLAYGADSVVFIGRVAIAAFPNNFFLKKENTPKTISRRQLDQIYKIVKGRLTEVKHRGKPSVPISRDVVFPIIHRKITAYRKINRRLIS